MSGTVLRARPLISFSAIYDTTLPPHFTDEKLGLKQQTACKSTRLPIPYPALQADRLQTPPPGNQLAPPLVPPPLPLLRTVTALPGGHGLFPLTPSDANAKAGTTCSHGSF